MGQSQLIDYNIEDIKGYIPREIIISDSNSKFLAGKNKNFSNRIKLYSIIKNDKDIFQLNDYSFIESQKIVINNFRFHPKYTKLMLSSLYNGKIKLYEIKDNKKNITLSTINAYDSCCFSSIFHPSIDELILSNSDDEIKVFDLTKFTYVQSISYELINKSIINWKNKNQYGYYDSKGIIIRDLNDIKDKLIIPLNKEIYNFYFMNDNNIKREFDRKMGHKKNWFSYKYN